MVTDDAGDAAGGGAAADPPNRGDHTGETEGDVVLDLSQARGDMWLVKIPHGELAEAITDALDNEVIGSVILKVSAPCPP